MPNDSSKQKRARANKAQREALAARTQAAGTPRPSRVAPAAGGATASTTTRRASKVSRPPDAEGQEQAQATASKRPASNRPPRPGDTPVDIDSLEGSFFMKVMQVPGGRQVLTAAFTAVIAAIGSLYMAFYVHTQPKAGLSKKQLKTAPNIHTVAEAYGTVSAVVPIVLITVLIGCALGFALHRQRRRIWLAVTVVGAMMVLQGLLLFIFAVGMVGFACYRAMKVEGPNEPLFGRKRRAAADTDSDGVDERPPAVFGRKRRAAAPADEALDTTGSEVDDE